MTEKRSNSPSKSFKLPFDNQTLGIQAVAGFTGGFIASPLMQISNKACLPNVTPLEVLKLTRKTPFMGSTWAATRQSLSSVRGTTSILYMRECLEASNRISWWDYSAAILVASAAETLIAGIPFEVPETRLQSGFSRYSWHCVKAIPFMYMRNAVTCVAPAYFCREEMLRAHDCKGVGGAKLTASNNDYKIAKTETQGSWYSAIGKTGLMSFCMAVIGSPIQGVVSRILQEENVAKACRNALRDFNFKDPKKRALTALRVATRASANSITGISITVAFLFSRDYIEK